jgi:uncharacterized protein (PEP-CTERM system associated)
MRVDFASRRCPVALTVLATALAAPCAAHAQMGMMGGSFGGLQIPRATQVAPSTVEVGVAGRATFTDNIDLRPRGQEEAGQIYEIAPFVRATASGPMLQGAAFYSPRLILRSDGMGTNSDVGHSLSATGNAFLVRDRVGVQARALVSEVNSNPFGPTSFDPALNRGNRSTYQLYELAPYVTGRIGAGTEYLARYGATYIDTDNQSYTTTQQRLTGSITNATSTSPWGWRAFADQQYIGYSNGFDYDQTYLTALGTYAFSQSLKLGLGTNWSRSSLLLSDAGDNNGWGVTATLEWAPTPRSQLAAFWASTYFGSLSRVQANHRAQNWVFGATFIDTIQNNAAAGFLNFNPTQTYGGDPYTGTSNTVAQQQGTIDNRVPYNNTLAFGTINSAIVHVRSLTASAGYLMVRTSYTLTGFVSEQDNSLNLDANVPGGNVPQDLTQRGLNFRVAHRLDSRITLTGIVRTQWNQSDALGETSRLNGVQLDAAYQFTSRITGSIGYRFTSQRGDGSRVLGYDENAIYIAGIGRF